MDTQDKDKHMTNTYWRKKGLMNVYLVTVILRKTTDDDKPNKLGYMLVSKSKINMICQERSFQDTGEPHRTH